MKIFQLFGSDLDSKLTILISGIILTIGFVFHAMMISRSWFFQDDFGFLFRYGCVSVQDMLNPATNFGRPVSRDLYWWVILKLFGRDAQAFFFVNMSIMICCSLLWGIWMRLLGASLSVSLISATMYMVMIPSIVNLSWISNSQHIMGHFSIFLILVLGALMKRGYIQADFKSWTFITIIFLLGLGCNVFVFFVLPVFMTQSVMWNPIQKDTGKMSIFYRMIPMTLAGLLLLFSLARQATSHYSVEFSIETLIQNIHYYYNSLGMKWYLIPCLIWVVMCLFWGRRRPVLLLLMTAVCFYVPFAFAKYQRCENYPALPLLSFLSASSWGMESVLSRPCFKGSSCRLLRTALPLMLLLAVFLTASTTRTFFASNPRGLAEHEFARVISSRLAINGGTICFEKGKESMGSTDNKIPGFWHFLGKGLAFRFFDPPDGKVRHYLLAEGTGCEDRDSLRVVVHHIDWNYYAEWKKNSAIFENEN